MTRCTLDHLLTPCHGAKIDGSSLTLRVFRMTLTYIQRVMCNDGQTVKVYLGPVLTLYLGPLTDSVSSGQDRRLLSLGDNKKTWLADDWRAPVDDLESSTENSDCRADVMYLKLSRNSSISVSITWGATWSRDDVMLSSHLIPLTLLSDL